MIKKLILTLTFIAFCFPALAGLEDGVGHAAWTEAENTTGTAVFGVGNATNSYTDWLTIPSAAEWASVQILAATSSSDADYEQQPATQAARFGGAITNASFVIEVAPLTVSSPTPPITTTAIPVFDVIRSGTDNISTIPVWTHASYSNFPIMSYYGIYRFPLRGEKALRVKFTRVGATTASTYHWAIVRFDKR